MVVIITSEAHCVGSLWGSIYLWRHNMGSYDNFRGTTWGSYGVVMTMSEAQHGVVILT